MHGLTATRRYVVHGSRVLERSGMRVVAYDARGHGHSAPALEPGAYEYELLAGDLQAVLEELELRSALLVGVSMGAHTALRFALEHPRRVHALCLITPAYDPAQRTGPDAMAHWDALASGLRAGGVEGFIRAYDLATVPAAWRATVEKALRQRLAAHAHPEAVADALEAVPRSRPFADLQELARVTVPAVVVGSRDELDPGHPLALAERYAHAIPRARLLVEDAGTPLAWRGGAVSQAILALARSAGQAGSAPSAGGHT